MLAKNKRQETYEEILEKVLQLEPNIQPQRFMIDLEMATINAIKKYFPQANVHGCFHKIFGRKFKM